MFQTFHGRNDGGAPLTAGNPTKVRREWSNSAASFSRGGPSEPTERTQEREIVQVVAQPEKFPARGRAIQGRFDRARIRDRLLEESLSQDGPQAIRVVVEVLLE